MKLDRKEIQSFRNNYYSWRRKEYGGKWVM
jgi:hypothetical protein